jgi:hypothetical protein
MESLKVHGRVREKLAMGYMSINPDKLLVEP